MKKVVIIGAGPAGLTAAYELLEDPLKYEVIILEETPDIGGISMTEKYNGKRMDIGGHRFFSKDKRIMQWWENIMPIQGKPSYDDLVLGREKQMSKGGPDPEKDDRVMLLRQRVSRIYYHEKFFDYPISMKPQTFINMGVLQTIKAGCSYLGSCLHKLPENSLENFYINRFGKVLYSMFFEGYTEKLWGRHPREISADWGEQRVKGLSVFALLKNLFIRDKKETSLIEEFIYPKLGPGQLGELVAEEIQKKGGRIQHGASVRMIEAAQNKVTGLIYWDKQSGMEKKIEGDIFISSMPLKDLVLGMGKYVPGQIRTIANGLSYRDFVTIGLLADKLKIKNETSIRTINNIVPDCWIYVQNEDVKLGRIQIFNNWSPYLVSNAESNVWLGLEYFCNENDDFWNLESNERVEIAVKELIKMGVIESREDVKDYHCKKVKKAYPAYFDTYKQIDKLIQWVDHIENLYCVGRNGQHRYNNMDHSMATSLEAVKNIRSGNKDKTAIWNVNTEKEYHEKSKSCEMKGKPA